MLGGWIGAEPLVGFAYDIEARLPPNRGAAAPGHPELAEGHDRPPAPRAPGAAILSRPVRTTREDGRTRATQLERRAVSRGTAAPGKRVDRQGGVSRETRIGRRVAAGARNSGIP